MENETKKDEVVVSTTPVVEGTTQTPQPVDYQVKYVELLEEVSPILEKMPKLESDLSNYKEAVKSKDRKLKELKDQGYVTEDDTDLEEKVVSKVAQMIEEKLSGLQPKQDSNSLLDRIKREKEELKVALINRQQISSTPQSSSHESQEVKKEFWSAEQLSYFKEHGIDAQKAYENWKALEK